MDDRISNFPNEILYHILSFLPTKQTVATSILSKRWRPLWRSVPTLDFTDEDVDHTGNSFRFVQSVYAVILSRDIHQPITKFQLRCLSEYFYYDPANVTIWVNAALQRRVQHLDLSLVAMYHRPSSNLSSIFSSTTLVVLKLQRMKLESVPTVELPLLKVLHLQDLTFSKYESLAEILDGCPNLEDLKVRGLYRRICCFWSYRACKTLPKLVRADISVADAYVLFLNVVENVKFLRLDEIVDVVLNETARDDPDYLPTFHNLTHMELVYNKFTSDWSDVAELLNHCPKLQDLVINQNGRFLKRMTISSGIAENRQKKRKMFKKLSSCFKRHSANCELSLT